MRLIDADELKRLGYILTRTYPKDPQTMVYEQKSVDDIPTIDPVRHGRWIDDTQEGKGEWLLCSECGEGSPEVCEWNYCPNCGARMDGGEE